MRNVDKTKTYVYQLRAENSTLPFYIGKGKAYRMYQHEGIADSGHKGKKYAHIRQLKAQGIKILVETLFESFDNALCGQKERELIAHYGKEQDGGCLLNITRGGEGKTGHVMPAEAVSNSVSKRKGQTRTKEARERMSEAQQGRIITEDHRKAIKRTHQNKSQEKKQIEGQKKSENSGRAKTSIEERATHLLQWESSGKTYWKYSVDNGISPSTFRIWRDSPYVKNKLDELKNQMQQPKSDLPLQELLNVDKSQVCLRQLTLPI